MRRCQARPRARPHSSALAPIGHGVGGGVFGRSARLWDNAPLGLHGRRTAGPPRLEAVRLSAQPLSWSPWVLHEERSGFSGRAAVARKHAPAERERVLSAGEVFARVFQLSVKG